MNCSLPSALKRFEKPRIVGSIYYIAPEVLRQLPYTTASDLWSFGCIMYLMLTGRPPFNGATKAEITAKILHHTYDKCLLYNSDIS